MTTRSAVVLALSVVCLGSLALAQPAAPPDPPLANWTAPPYWVPTLAVPEEGQPDRGHDVQLLGVEVGTAGAGGRSAPEGISADKGSFSLGCLFRPSSNA